MADNVSVLSGEEADWTREPPPSQLYQQTDGTRRLRRNGSDKDSDDQEEEDCCCCPLDPILCWFRFFHFVSGIVGLATLGANAYVIATIDRYSFDYKDFIMRIYAIMFCVIIVLVEIYWRCVVRRMRILDLWFFRGLFYFFVGFITIQGDKSFTDPQDIIGLIQAGVGALYMLMGALCIKSIKTQRLALYENKTRLRNGLEPSYASV